MIIYMYHFRFAVWHLHVLLNVGEECVMRFMVRDHNPSAISHVKHELTNIKWFIVAPWPTSSCALTFDAVSADGFC